jgi:hypothetical protein
MGQVDLKAARLNSLRSPGFCQSTRNRRLAGPDEMGAHQAELNFRHARAELNFQNAGIERNWAPARSPHWVMVFSTSGLHPRCEAQRPLLARVSAGIRWGCRNWTQSPALDAKLNVIARALIATRDPIAATQIVSATRSKGSIRARGTP